MQLEEMMDERESAGFESDTEVKMFAVYQIGERGGPRSTEKDREVYILPMWEIWIWNRNWDRCSGQARAN